MTAPKQVLDTAYFNNLKSYPDRDGLILDYSSALDKIAENTGENYIKQTDYRLSGTFHNPAAVIERSKIAEPHIIATFDPHDTSDLPDINTNSFVVKNRGDDFFAVPIELKTALTKIHAAATDLIQIYGKERFLESEATFILQREDIETGRSARPQASSWHNHVSASEKADLLYLFHDVLGTQFSLNQHQGKSVSNIKTTLPNNIVSRMGGEIMHRSQTENPHQKLRREWGGLKIMTDKQPISRRQNGRASNLSMVGRDSPLFEKFSQAAQNIIERQNSVHAFTQPKNVIDFAPAELEHS